MLSRRSSLLSLVTSVYFFSTLLVAVVKAASDDKTRLGNHTIDRVSLFSFFLFKELQELGRKLKMELKWSIWTSYDALLGVSCGFLMVFSPLTDITATDTFIVRSIH